jgi:hypothetical protein
MPESSLRSRLVIARAPDSTLGDVSGIATRLQTDTELFWLLRIARPVAAAPKVVVGRLPRVWPCSCWMTI